MSARWGPGPHRRRSTDTAWQVLRDLPFAIVVTVGMWAFCALLFAVAG